MTLPEFLLARYAEEEATAQWVGERYAEGAVFLGGQPAHVTSAVLVIAERPVWSVARVLADCQAKRRIIDWHGERDGCCEERYGAMVGTQRFIGCVTLMHLALPYADHPDYREEWRP